MPPANPTLSSRRPTQNFTWAQWLATRPSAPSVKPAPAVVARPDPLAVTKTNGTSLGGVDQFGVAKDMAAALRNGADVPGRVQDGPTCGLYALGMVMDYWDKKNSKNLNPFVQSSDAVRWDSHSVPADTKRNLFDVAKQKGFTKQGEMFHADQLATLAKDFGYNATTKDNMTLGDIKAAVDRNHPALVAFDVDQKGNPGLYEGKRAHWAVIEGYFTKDGVDYLVATHGWTGKEYVWKAEDFMASVNQLNTSDFPAAPKDITKTLKARLVEVWPKG